jgi:Protein of unknown function (DUF1579)
MKYVLFAALVLCAAAPSRAATGIDALGRLEGSWTATATALATPYSKAGSTTGDTTCAWSSSRDFLICQQAVSSDGQITHDVAIYAYDTAGAKYHFYAARVNGVSDVGIAVDATSITYTSTFTDGGKNVTVRTINVWDDADHYRFWTEYSTDGKTWEKMLTGSAQRPKS